MSADLYVAGLFGALAVLGYLMLFHLPSRRSARETARRPLLEARCVVRNGYGLGFYLGGFGRLALYDDFLVAAYLLRNEIAYGDIARAEVRPRLFGKGVYLYPRASGRLRYVAVFPREYEQVLELLERSGVPVKRDR